MTTAVVVAVTDRGAVSMAVTVPPSNTDVERLLELARMPGLADAEWSGRPGGLRG